MIFLWRDGSLCRTMSQEEEYTIGCLAVTIEEIEFNEKLARACAFVNTFSFLHHLTLDGDTELRRAK
jgi:hypothetical protein